MENVAVDANIDKLHIIDFGLATSFQYINSKTFFKNSAHQIMTKLSPVSFKNDIILILYVICDIFGYPHPNQCIVDESQLNCTHEDCNILLINWFNSTPLSIYIEL